MKRIIALALLACLLLSGCSFFARETAPTTEEATRGTTEATVKPTTPVTPTVPPEPTVEVTEPVPQKVTVYLLESVAHADNGITRFRYDEKFNLISFKSLTIENTERYHGTFEEPNANGMPGKAKIQWPEMEPQVYTLTYFEDSKLDSVASTSEKYTGYQRSYNEKGDVTELRNYSDGILQDIVLYEYDNGTLKAVRCEDPQGKKLYECKVENGRIVERTCYSGNDVYSYKYNYDKNGNLQELTITIDGVTMVDSLFNFVPAEVEPDRVEHLKQQQAILRLFP